MIKNDWISVQEVEDDTRIWAGTIVRVFKEELNKDNIQDNFYDYIVSFIYDNNEYLQLTCLTQGEGGNIVSVLQTEPDSNYSLGKELKRMMDDGKNSVFVKFSPKCIVN
ncbi:hypothetical protein [Bacillus pumilus]|uniref:Uncharacterized protein n=1 Tax=Bacillus pumilus (strain SAFR-032) TaxID=315750 RepID=A8FIJ1_BACP2|nr:hypothetical protein [Bacillus pumilus]ABV64058.1 hypothetical protein BPUM_3406 [Bacillus pumilus SAFR-032]MBC3641186.1 hypothetical protein [Bacillus pumilus]MBC3647171.1 hypothetical protein [Bacillus pumilus]MBC3648492.1 hypothetical protein [Bacillus pumilus]MBC3652452.1 hypothetical protein [Bacillus pumilus]